MTFGASNGNTLPDGAVKVTKANNANCLVYLKHKGMLYCTVATIQKKAVDPKIMSYERQKISFGPRSWYVAWGEHNRIMTSIEYIPAGESLSHWTQMITSQYIPEAPDVSAVEFGNRFLYALKKSRIKHHVSIIEKHPKLFIFEVQINKPQNLQHDEIQKIVQGRDGIYVLHYLIKKPDMGQSMRHYWIDAMKRSSVK